MNGRQTTYGLLLAGISAMVSPAHAFDVLRAEQGISESAAGVFVPVCQFEKAPGRPLRLQEAVERALCGNPKTRAAWAAVKAQAAGVGVARAAYLPQASANWQGVRVNSVTDVENHPSLSSNINANVRSVGVNLNWLLYDFGGREAGLRNANALLEAARAAQEATLMDEFASIAMDYYTVQTAIGELESARDIEAMTRRSMDVAQVRAEKGVVPITDALQAQTQHAQAVFNLTKAQVDAQTALGTLASDMNLDPSVPLEVPPVTEGARTDRTFSEPVAQMIREVEDTHPSVRAARAQYEAALAQVSQTRGQGLPGISLVAKYSQNNQPQSMGIGLPTYPATGHDAYIGVRVSIPLFEGFGRQYQINQAKAEAERQAAAVDEAKQKVALDVWSSYHTLTGATKAAGNSANLLAIAARSYDAARSRYEAGVGNILELINTQAALANAKQRRVRALSDWDNARIDLASKLGKLGREDVP